MKWREPHQPVRWTGRLDVFMAVCLDRETDQGFLFRCPEFLGKQSPLVPLVRRSPPNQYKVGPETIAINGYKWCEITSISKVLTTPVISHYPKQTHLFFQGHSKKVFIHLTPNIYGPITSSFPHQQSSQVPPRFSTFPPVSRPAELRRIRAQEAMIRCLNS